jgi:hypothetical protein
LIGTQGDCMTCYCEFHCGEMEPHCVLIYIFLMDTDVDHFFMVTGMYFFFWKLFNSFAHLFNLFYLFNFLRSLYILDIYALLDE